MNDDGGFIENEVIDRVNWIVDDDVLLHDSTFDMNRLEEAEERHLSELYRLVLNMDKKEMAITLSAILEKQPFLAYQVLAWYGVRKGERN